MMTEAKENSKYKIKGGYSLIEILLYIALFGIFLTSISSLFVASVDLRLETEATSGVEQDGRFILQRFRYDITRASSITTPGALGAQGSTLVLVRDGVTYTYSLVGGNLQVVSGGNTDVLNSPRSQISTINFRRLGNVGGKNTITIDYTVTSVTQRNSGPETRDYTVTFGIR